MTPEAQKAFLDEPDRPWGSAHQVGPTTRRDGLKRMCDFGAGEVSAGRCGAIEFSVFNIAEANFVKAYMDEKHPGIAYRRNWLNSPHAQPQVRGGG